MDQLGTAAFRLERIMERYIATIGPQRAKTSLPCSASNTNVIKADKRYVGSNGPDC